VIRTGGHPRAFYRNRQLPNPDTVGHARGADPMSRPCKTRAWRCWRGRARHLRMRRGGNNSSRPAPCTCLHQSGRTGDAQTASGNVAPITVDGDRSSAMPGRHDQPGYTSVTVCAPGTSNCADHRPRLGRHGFLRLRLMCTPFGGEASSIATKRQHGGQLRSIRHLVYLGRVRTADVKIGGESASSIRSRSSPMRPCPPPHRAVAARGPRQNTVLRTDRWEPMEFWGSAYSGRTAARLCSP